MLTIQNYVRAESLQQAYDLYQNKRSRVIGGMMWLRMSNLSLHTAIDLGGLGLDTIEETPEGFSIGACVTLRMLEQHAGLNAATGGAAAAAVRDIVGVQFRNMATVGGSIYGRYGFSDVLTLMLALNTRVELFHAGIIPLEAYAAIKPDRDLVVRLLVPRPDGPAVYQAVRAVRTDFPLLTCCAASVNGDIRLSIGARPGRAILLPDEYGILAHGITAESAEAMAVYAANTIRTGSNSRGSAAYRTRLVHTLTRRVLLEMGGLTDAT